MCLINYGEIIDMYKKTLNFDKISTNIYKYFICVIIKTP
jgi:hypothetical protein